MVGGADLQLFFAFEVIERHSGCKSWWLNSPKLHLSLQIDSYCFNNLSGFYNAAGFGGAELTLRHKDMCFGYYAFSRGKPVPWCPSETLYPAWSSCTGQTFARALLWDLAVEVSGCLWKDVLILWEALFFPIVQKFKKFRSKKSLQEKNALLWAVKLILAEEISVLLLWKTPNWCY